MSTQQNLAQVTVSILPQSYFVERIAGEFVGVNVMVGPGQEPHTYEPKPEQMRALTQSEIFFTIGVEYEAVWMPRFEDINPDMKIVDTTQGIQRIPLAAPHTDQDQEANHKEDHNDGLDPHVWLSPRNGQIIAENIYFALLDLVPEHAEILQENFKSLIGDIEALDARIQADLEKLDQRNFMVFHPAWGYFADQYHLKEIPIQVGGQDPSASELAMLIDIAQKDKIKVIFVQPTFNTANAEAIAKEINGQVVVVDPLAEDWLSNLENAAKAFRSALQE